MMVGRSITVSLVGRRTGSRISVYCLVGFFGVGAGDGVWFGAQDRAGPSDQLEPGTAGSVSRSSRCPTPQHTHAGPC
jgi:hypothetical protein